MSRFLIESPDGKRKSLTLEELSRNLCLNGILYEVSGDSEKGIGFIGHKTLVFFAYTWETWVLEASEKKAPEAVEALRSALRLVRLWLEDSESVSNEELQAAAWAAESVWAAGAAAGAAKAAGDAAWVAARAAWAAGDTSEAAWVAGDTSEAAWAAAGAAAYQKQGEFILAHLKSNRSLWDL
jgi:hypothetical protein